MSVATADDHIGVDIISIISVTACCELDLVLSTYNHSLPSSGLQLMRLQLMRLQLMSSLLQKHVRPKVHKEMHAPLSGVVWISSSSLTQGAHSLS